MTSLPDFTLLRSFCVVAQDLSFRRGAERLSIDQSALSRRIQRLEDDLGYPLFERTTREVMLTRAGLTFYGTATTLLSDYAKSVTEARRVAEGRKGRLRVGYMAFAATELMPQTVALYAARYPEIAIELQYIRTQGQKLALANDEIDVGFMIGPYTNSGFQSEMLSNDRLCVVLPKGHALLRKPVLDPLDLKDETLVLGDMSEWGEYRYRLDTLCSQVGLPVQPAFEATNTLALVGLVAAGLGVTIYPESLLGFLGNAIETRPIDHDLFRSSTVLVWKRTNRALAIRNFVAAARERTRLGVQADT
ncbi:MAG: LysR family transcriptional regulator [Pseudomonadota bacterium]